ncbi:MAG: hypothetical protein KID09_11650 [Paenibacillus macerans]|nr:hypothetical protein [Paenibacillus macerans]
MAAAARSFRTAEIAACSLELIDTADDAGIVFDWPSLRLGFHIIHDIEM